VTQPLDLLIVDEDIPTLKQLGKGLSKRGYRVTKIQNSVDALEILAQHTYQVLIADDEMDRIPWSDLVLKARRRVPALTIVLLTSTITKDVIDAVSTGIIDGYLLKPALVNELEEEIMDVLRI
jgi:DNA-binding response OmpR family regulator